MHCRSELNTHRRRGTVCFLWHWTFSQARKQLLQTSCLLWRWQTWKLVSTKVINLLTPSAMGNRFHVNPACPQSWNPQATLRVKRRKVKARAEHAPHWNEFKLYTCARIGYLNIEMCKFESQSANFSKTYSKLELSTMTIIGEGTLFKGEGGTSASQENYRKCLLFELATVTSQALEYDVIKFC